MRADRKAAVELEVARLRDLEPAALRTRWRMATGRAAPASVSRGLLLRMLAYRIQADALGDLDPATARFLDRIAADPKLARSTSIPLPDRERAAEGAILIREWEGVSYRVAAVADGYAWNGVTYRSLSEVARAITGVRWNGPRFFGLRDREARP
jgi:hypothetical protein